MMRAQQQIAFILHTRPFRNTSLLVDCFSREYGRLTLIARSARGPRSRFRGLITPFSQLELNWAGRGELKYLQQAEHLGASYPLQASSLVQGLYVNELLYRLLEPGLSFPALYDDYAKMIAFLSRSSPIRARYVMCYFELRLLSHLGYALTLTKTIAGDPIEDDKLYRYRAGDGFAICHSIKLDNPTVFAGESLLALERYQLKTDQQLSHASRLLRSALEHQLDGRTLHSLALM